MPPAVACDNGIGSTMAGVEVKKKLYMEASYLLWKLPVEGAAASSPLIVGPVVYPSISSTVDGAEDSMKAMQKLVIPGLAKGIDQDLVQRRYLQVSHPAAGAPQTKI